MSPAERRDDILDAVLEHVAVDGWSRRAIAGAASDLGISVQFIELAFPGGSVEMLQTFLHRLDDDLRDRLEQIDGQALRVRDRIRTGVLTRLEINHKYRSQVRRTVAFLALPGRKLMAARAIWRMADIIWIWAGDTSTDYNWYSKRAILSGIYTATLLVWLNDRSENYQESQGFLDRRIDGVMRFEKAKARVRGLRERLPDSWTILARLRDPAGAGECGTGVEKGW